jgi:hypothetical protein
MQSSESCRECNTIAEELAMAYKQAWDSADPATRRAWTAIYKMNTEENVQRVEELMQGRHTAHSKLPGLTKCCCGFVRTPSCASC